MNSCGICQLTLIPVRKEPSERSEMVTQLLFGELFDILGENEGWVHINTQFDHYQGWITTRMATILDEKSLGKYQDKEQLILKGPFATLVSPTPGLPIILAGGSVLTMEYSQAPAGNHNLIFENKAAFYTASSTPDITGMARKYLNAPYLWGGRTIFGIDCSGFTQIIFKMNGIALPRDAWQQAELGNAIASLQDIRAGDLAFFENPEGKIIHTGIILENSEIIHASGRVRIDGLDGEGIIDRETRQYSHHLKAIKRIV